MMVMLDHFKVLHDLVKVKLVRVGGVLVPTTSQVALDDCCVVA
jgi:hypothetical protein